MNKEERKIGMYTETEIFEYLATKSMLGRSIYDAIIDTICALETENKQSQQEKENLIKYLEDSVKTINEYWKEAYIEELNEYGKGKRDALQEILEKVSEKE